MVTILIVIPFINLFFFICSDIITFIITSSFELLVEGWILIKVVALVCTKWVSSMCFTLAVGTGRWLDGISLNDFTVFEEDNVITEDSYEFRYVVFEDSNVSVEYDEYDENTDVPCVISDKDNKLNYDDTQYSICSFSSNIVKRLQCTL